MIYELSFLWCYEYYRWYSSYLLSNNINTLDVIRVVFSLILWILLLIVELSSHWYYESYRWYLSCLLSYTLNPIDDILSKMLNTVKKLKNFGRIGWIWVLIKLCLFWTQYKCYSIGVQYLSSVYTSAVKLIGRTQVWKKKCISKYRVYVRKWFGYQLSMQVCCTFLAMKRRITVISLRPL